MNRESKKKSVDFMKSSIFNSGTFFIFSNLGLSVDEFFALRKKIREAGGQCFVAKNKLAKIALRDLEVNDQVIDSLKGPTALVSAKTVDDSDSGDDISARSVSIAKILVDFCKDVGDKAEIICGAMSGNFVNEKSVVSFASLPSYDTLRATLLNTLTSPGAKLLTLLNEPSTGLVRALKAKSEG